MDLSKTKDIVQLVVWGIAIIGVPVGICKYVINRKKEHDKALDELSEARSGFAQLAQKRMPPNSYIDAYSIEQEKYLAVLEKVCHRFWTKRELLPVKEDLLLAKEIIGDIDCKDPYLHIKKAIKRINLIDRS